MEPGLLMGYIIINNTYKTISCNIYNLTSMHAHRMLQGWFFLSAFWTPDRAKTFLTNVPLVS